MTKIETNITTINDSNEITLVNNPSFIILFVIKL